MTVFYRGNYFVPFAMILNIKEVPFGRSVVDQETEMTDEQNRDGNFVGPVNCHAEIERQQFQMFITMTYTCTVRQECSRCLRGFDLPLQGNFSIIVQDVHAKEDFGTDDVDYFYDDRDAEIDLRSSIYDEVMINMAIKPLCDETCTGGDNNQSQVYQAEDVSVDPRWEALKKLKEKM